MEERIIRKEDFITSKWAGGETTQLTIYPEDAVFADRNFLFRISSATFTSTESEFSDFTGYQRYILPLEGSLKLDHKGLYKRNLDKYSVEYFDGSWSTYSENTLDCRDYNFIVKNGNQAKMQILKAGEEYGLKALQIVTIFSTEDYEISLGNEKKKVEGFSLLILENDKEEKLVIERASMPVIVTEFLKK